MERRQSYSRIVYTPTSASRVASVKNNREALLLVKASKGLSHESEGTLRTFYREKARTSNFLQKVYGKNAGMFKAELEKNGQLTTDDRVDQKISVITRSEAREAIKAQRMRRISLDISQTAETQRRIQDFLTRDIPGGSSTMNKQVGQVNGFNVVNEFKDMNLNKESSTDGNQTQGPAKKHFRVRSRASGICFSCSRCHSRCHLQRLPSESMPNIATKHSEEYPWKSTKTKFRKLSVPVMGSKMSLDRNRTFDVNPPCRPSTGSDKTSTVLYKARPNRLNSAPIKKHSI